MCTAVSLKAEHHYFGRTLDLERSYNERIAVTPRRFDFNFRMTDGKKEHFAMIGVSCVVNGYPLYYDAVNEKGLCIAGLNFPGNAFYGKMIDGKINLAPFEFIPYLLSNASCVSEAVELMKSINLVSLDFSKELPVTPLHWLISDGERNVVAEPAREGLKLYDDPYGVLTNNPPFDKQLFSLSNYRNITPFERKSDFSEKSELMPYSRGMGAIGLPGDVSSQSRYVRAVFTKLNSVGEDGISRFFHILGTVEQVEGCVILENGEKEKTVYTSCCDADIGVYYYTTYENRCIYCVDMHKEELNGENAIDFSIKNEQYIREMN